MGVRLYKEGDIVTRTSLSSGYVYVYLKLLGIEQVERRKEVVSKSRGVIISIYKGNNERSCRTIFHVCIHVVTYKSMLILWCTFVEMWLASLEGGSAWPVDGSRGRLVGQPVSSLYAKCSL